MVRDIAVVRAKVIVMNGNQNGNSNGYSNGYSNGNGNGLLMVIVLNGKGIW